MTKSVAICTLGCKVNAYESEAVAEQFATRGYFLTDFDQAADIYIINTCTVTHLSSRKSRQMIRRTKQLNPNAVLVVMGCYAQTAPEEVAAIPEVDLILGTGDKGRTADVVEEFLLTRKRACLVSGLDEKDEFEELCVTSYEGRSRAFLKVQDGCNNFCSYCIIPYARGRIRSRSLESCVVEAKRLSQSGFSEIVLVGIHLASYGKERGGPYLIDLLAELNKIDGIARIRLGSLEPTLFDDIFTQQIAGLSKVCRHFHLSLQSGCDETLFRMNRHYSTADYEAAVLKIRRALPGAAITTDIMVGFPGETEEEFLNTLAFVEKIGFADAHVFKYSVRKGTKAEKMDGQVAPEVKEDRSHRLIGLVKTLNQQFVASYIGKTVSVLFEQEHKGIPNLYEGKTDNYITVLAKSQRDVSGEFHTVAITGEKDGLAIGELTEEHKN